MDILIYAKPEKVEHKMIDVIIAGYCFWTVGIHPNLKNKVIDNVYFSNGRKIYAKGKFIGIDYENNKKVIYFEPLEKVTLKQPKKPPTRGWCYINKEK